MKFLLELSLLGMILLSIHTQESTQNQEISKNESHEEQSHQEQSNQQSKQSQEQDESEEVDLDNFLKEMDDFECTKKPQEDQDDENYNQLCEQNLQQGVFKLLGDFKQDGESFWQYLDNKIYKPLAFDIPRSTSVSDMLKQLVLLDDQHSEVYSDNINTNFEQFQDDVLNKFENMQKSSALEQTGDVSKQMIELLKSFHVHWNKLRLNDELPRVKGETKNLMKKILQTYQVREKFLFEMAKTFVDKIKHAYQNFIQAHLTYKLIKSKAPDMLGTQIVDRYKNTTKSMVQDNQNSMTFVEQISNLIFLTESFHMIAYRVGYSKHAALLEFEQKVEEPIKEYYNEITKTLQDDKYLIVKDFTASVLLKFKHVHFVMFTLKIMSQEVVNPFVEQQNDKRIYVEIYQELFDNLMLIPVKCVNQFLLKNCTYYYANKVLKYLNKKYQIKLRTQGWYIHNFIKGILKDMFTKTNNMVWGNFTLFKNYFYQNLFIVQENFRQQFFINNTPSMDNLDDIINQRIDKFYKEKGLQQSETNVLLERFEKEIYEKLIWIRGYFNNLAPFDQKMEVLAKIKSTIEEFFDHFKEVNFKFVNDDFLDFLKNLDEDITQWSIQEHLQPKTTVQISELPLTAQNLYPQVFHTVHLEGQEEVEQQGNYKGFLQDPHQKLKIPEENQMSEKEQKKVELKKELQTNPEKFIDKLYEEEINLAKNKSSEEYKKQVDEKIKDIHTELTKDNLQVYQNGLQIPNYDYKNLKTQIPEQIIENTKAKQFKENLPVLQDVESLQKYQQELIPQDEGEIFQL